MSKKFGQMNIEVIKNNLQKAIYNYNSEIVASVCNEIKKEEYTNKEYVLWFYNNNEDEKSIVEVLDGDIKKDNNSILKEYGEKFLFYLWIECGDARINFCYKDIDTTTLNIHVIPGVVQKYSKIYKECPLLEFTDQGLIMKNVPRGTEYLPFAEKIGDSLWVPEKAENDAFFKLDKIKEYDALSKNLRNQLMEVRKYSISLLKEIEGVEIGRGGLGVGSKYTFIEWINAKYKELPFSFNLMYIFYRENVGILTAYDVANITRADSKKQGKVANVLNYRIDGEKSVEIVYDIKADKPSENRTNNGKFRFEDLDKPSVMLQKIKELLD